MNLGRMVMIAGIAYGIMYPQVLSGLTESMYEHTLSAPMRPLAVQMTALSRRVEKAEQGYERKVYSRSETRTRLLALYYEYDRLLYKISTIDADRYERDEVAERVRSAQAAINTWGLDHGF